MEDVVQKTKIVSRSVIKTFTTLRKTRVQEGVQLPCKTSTITKAAEGLFVYIIYAVYSSEKNPYAVLIYLSTYIVEY